MQNRDQSGSRRRGRSGPPRGRGRPVLSLQERLSRYLAFILRHHPEEAGLELDERGTADLEEVVAAVRRRPGMGEITRERIEGLVAGQQAQRFQILGDRIRARYGHSLAAPIRYEPADPPAELFHGTEPERADGILEGGLEPGQRKYVHLSPDVPAARQVGRRRCPDPAVLRVDAAGASKAGVRFYHAAPSVWLSDPIPPECITRAE